MSELIGPLTAEEWCEFRLRGDDDLIRCCGNMSDVRDSIFHLLRMGGAVEKNMEYITATEFFVDVWEPTISHGDLIGRGMELLQKMHDYYAPYRKIEFEEFSKNFDFDEFVADQERRNQANEEQS